MAWCHNLRAGLREGLDATTSEQGSSSAFEPYHEIMVLFILLKLILQMHMDSHPMVLGVWFSVFNTSGVQTAKALASAFAGRLCDKYHNLMSWLSCLKVDEKVPQIPRHYLDIFLIVLPGTLSLSSWLSLCNKLSNPKTNSFPPHITILSTAIPQL